MTTKSSIRTIKPRISSSNSVNNMTTNGGETKSSRICIKKPLSTTNFLQNNSGTNGFSNHIKKRTLQFNNFLQSKIKSNHSNEQNNGLQSNEHSTSPPLVFHAIAPASPEEINNLSKQNNTEQKTQSPPESFVQSDDEFRSPSSLRIAHILAHTNIKTMETGFNSNRGQSSCSEEEDDRSKFVSVDADDDADESDNDSVKKLKKSRRIPKARRTSNSSLIQKAENHNGKDEQQHSSSNDDEHKASNSNLNGNNERRTKPPLIRKSEHFTATTTTDDDITRQYYCYHPLDNLESKFTNTTTTNESNLSSPIPTMITAMNPPSVKKINRFQVKSIRKSQQPQVLLASTIKARSSHDDDCSVLNQQSNSHLKLSMVERKNNTRTPTTDGENPPTHTDGVVNHGLSTLHIVENGHHRVRFHVTPHGKHESATEEEKLSSQSVATVVLPTPAPPSTTASTQGDDDEEGEAIAKSPDDRFIKYAKEIGRGAFKTVYRGLDTEASIAVAWCELQDFAQFDKHERARFKEEAEMLKKLQHPNIVRFYDFWEETNPRTNKKVIILVTELMTSGSLKGYIRKFKGQKEEKRINVMKKWCRQILKGLAYLHGRNPPVIHRDLKCDNVFISSTTGCVKIGDLGLATFKTQTFAKSMRGTMEFMAPEMFDEQYDERVDIYSFGLCMLEMITGEYPYIECKGPTAVIKRVTAGLKPDCYYKVESEDVREVIDCCIRTNKEERLSVQELLPHSFFLDDTGLRVDFVRDPANDLQVMVTNDSIDLKLKIVDKTKRKALWAEHEAIRFRYNFTSETPEQIVNELIEKKYIVDDDKKFVIQSIKDRLRAYQYEQIDRKAGVFCRETKPTMNHSSQSLQAGQQQHQMPPAHQQSAPPVVAQHQVAVVPSTTSTPSLIPQPPADVQQQPQTAKLPAELAPTKPIVATEPIPIVPASELSSSVSGSAGSLEKLDAALKITLFNKTKSSQSINSSSTITNDISEPPTPIVIQDDSSVTRLGNDITISDQRPTKESGGPIISSEIATNLFQSSTPSTLQTQSQPTTMLTNQQQMLQNPLLLTQTPSSYSYSTVTPSPHLINSTLPNETIKQLTSSSSSSNPIETIENSHTSISPSHTLETFQSSLPSDTSLPTQPPMLDSLKHLDAMLKNALKNPSKTAGTAHNSDTETANTHVSLAAMNENSIKSIEMESDEIKHKLIDQLNTCNSNLSSIFHSQPSTSSTVLPVPIQQVKSQPTSHIPIHSDLFISPEKNIHDLEILLKSPHNKSLSNDDTIVASSSSSSDLSDIKLMLTDLSKNLLNRMNILESKIDEHRNQTIQINYLLTTTVLPSLVDIAGIISETPHLNSRIRTKLETIQTNLRSSQVQTEMKDLMEI